MPSPRVQQARRDPTSRTFESHSRNPANGEKSSFSGLDETVERRDEQNVLALQRLLGNQATARLIARRTEEAEPPGGAEVQRTQGGPPVIQRGLFSWLAKKFAPKPPKTPPPSDKVETEVTSTPKTVEPEQAPVKVPEHPPEGKTPLTLAGGQKILKDAFGKTKEFIPGQIEIHDTAGFKAAYDKIYGSGQWSWDRYVVPTYGGLNGFAHNGVNYINSDSAGLHTVVHEMLHNNVAPDWRGVVGDRWDEGTTEILTQVACAKVNEPAPVCYPGESPVVQVALDMGLPLADLQDAYLTGGAQAKIAGWADKNCKENWAGIKGHMQAKDWAAAKAALAKKTESVGASLGSGQVSL